MFLSAPDTTEVIYGADNIVGKTVKALPEVKKSLDGCYDSAGPSMVVTTEPVWKAVNELAKRGINLRYITDISTDNIAYCKMMIENGHQLRHLPGIKSNFAIADRTEYMANIVLEKEKPLWQVLVSNVKTFVEGQQSVFDTLWNRALPAEQRIREIEEGVTPEFTERLTDPSEIQKITFDLVRSAKEEIKIIFSTANAFKRQEHSGLMWLLQKTDPSVTVRILIPTAFELDEKMKRNFVNRKIEIRNFVNSSLKAIFTTLMVDAKLCFELENKDEKDNSYDQVGIATYSNSNSALWTHTSIFETLWMQSRPNLRTNTRH